MNPVQTAARPSPEAILMQGVQALRENPEKYQELRAQLLSTDSEEERVQRLLTFATSGRELAALRPAAAVANNGAELAWTTVTVTTVLILADSAY